MDAGDRVWVHVVGKTFRATICETPARDGWTLGPTSYLIRYDEDPHHVYVLSESVLEPMSILDQLAEI